MTLAAQLPATGRTISLADADLYAYEAGPASGDAVVLVHGFLTSSATWRHIYPELARRHRVVLLDLPGCGRSPAPRRRDWTASRAAALLVAAFDALGLEHPTLIGSQLGGSIASWVAAEHPDRIEALVVMAAGALGEAGSNLALYRALAAPVLGPLVARALPYRFFAARWAAAHGPGHPPDRQAVARYHEQLRERGAVMARFGLGVRRSYGESFDALAGPITRVSVPTLLIFGDADPLVPPSTGHRYAELVPHARLVLLPGCGDFPQEEAPREVLAALRGFLGGTGEPAR
ncbi:MAG TPA: alpha/beta hydrolase [Kineosporiaceae bacterium]